MPVAPRRRPPATSPGTRRARSVLPVAVGLAAATVLVASPVACAAPSGPATKVASGLNTPWELAVAPDGRTFVSERGGNVRVLGADDTVSGSILSGTDPAFGGEVRKFLGLALDPHFATNRLAYLYVSIKTADDAPGNDINGRNGIWRLREENGRFVVQGKVFDGIDSDGNHDGGRMVFGPDGALYVTTGDIHQPARPQDKQSLNGKILRFGVPTTGALTVPGGNPFVAEGGNARYVWSYGHRHPQGLAFDAAGRLWETEHGPTGEQHGAQYPGGNGKTGRDELNVITRGGDYGWPLVSGPDNRPGLIAPVAVAGDSPSWAPGDVAVGRDGSVYSPFLAGSRLQRFDVRDGKVTGQASSSADLGRLRVAVAVGPNLLIAQDGADAGIYRVPLSAPTAGGSDAATPPSATTPPPAGSAAAEEARRERTRARTLARRMGGAVTKVGRRRLILRRPAVTRAPAPSAGRTTIELRLRSSKGPLLARTRPRATTTTSRRYRLRPTRTGVRRLRASGSRRLVVRVVHRPSTGTTVRSLRGVRIARRAR